MAPCPQQLDTHIPGIPSLVHAFSYFDKFLLSTYYVPDTILVTEDIEKNKMNKNPYFRRAFSNGTNKQ